MFVRKQILTKLPHMTASLRVAKVSAAATISEGSLFVAKADGENAVGSAGGVGSELGVFLSRHPRAHTESEHVDAQLDARFVCDVIVPCIQDGAAELAQH